jgi:hypothetical protein
MGSSILSLLVWGDRYDYSTKYLQDGGDWKEVKLLRNCFGTLQDIQTMDTLF